MTMPFRLGNFHDTTLMTLIKTHFLRWGTFRLKGNIEKNTKITPREN